MNGGGNDPGDKKTWAPTWGFVTCTKDPGTSVKGIKEVFPRGDGPLIGLVVRSAAGSMARQPTAALPMTMAG
jgi:hypothetical protein